VALTYATEYDTLDFEDLQSLSDPVSASNLFISSSPPAFELPSPTSDFSSLCGEDLFDQKPLINPWVVPTALNKNTTNPTTSWSTPSGENSPDMELPDLASPSESSGSNSPRDIKHNIKTKRLTKRGQKHPSEDCRAKSPGSLRQKPHNLIEKKYRNNLNSKIMSLRDSIPSLRSTNENNDSENAMDSDAGESRKALKCSKVRAIFSLKFPPTTLSKNKLFPAVYIFALNPTFDHKLTRTA
jgi:hypothetical protein